MTDLRARRDGISRGARVVSAPWTEAAPDGRGDDDARYEVMGGRSGGAGASSEASRSPDGSGRDGAGATVSTIPEAGATKDSDAQQTQR